MVVPRGDWRTGAIHLKSNVALDLREGSRIVFTDDPADYLPAVHTNWEGVEARNVTMDGVHLPLRPGKAPAR